MDSEWVLILEADPVLLAHAQHTGLTQVSLRPQSRSHIGDISYALVCEYLWRAGQRSDKPWCLQS